ncbi:MAG: transcription antitermination factor NusB [Bacteroidota bacterium]
MITRRLLRIKVLQIVFSYYYSGGKSLDKAEKELLFSINKFYDLYHQLLRLVIDLKKYAEHRIDLAASKKAPSYDDLHPNKKFAENRVIKQLEHNETLNRYLTTKKIGWSNDKDFIKRFYNHLIESEVYQNYMNSEKNSYEEDKAFVNQVYTEILPDFELLFQLLEEQSIYWNDEIELVISYITQTIDAFEEDEPSGKELLPLFRKDEDKDFARNLLKKTILTFDEYDELIKEHSKNWDLERIAFMDIIIMKMAITEMLKFPSIPTKVTLDEYIEIAKYYSTEKSNVFINGILDKIIEQLRKENRIQKQGRGLIGEN